MLLRSYEPNVDEPMLLELGDGALLAAWDDRDEAPGGVEIAIDGVPAERCRASLRVATREKLSRTILVFRVPGRSRGELSLDRNGATIARLLIDDDGPHTLERLIGDLD